jgi:hypothetical protein
VAFLLALFLYFPASEVARALASNKVLDPDVAAWTGQALLVAVAAVLAWPVFRR